jgi:hypothetical protein
LRFFRMSARRSPFSDETGSPTFGKLAALPGIMEDVASIKLRTATARICFGPAVTYPRIARYAADAIQSRDRLDV